MGVVQSNLKEYHTATRNLIGGRDGLPLDPRGIYADLEDDPTLEEAKALYFDTMCYPRW